jgi:hypothetical protein
LKTKHFIIAVILFVALTRWTFAAMTNNPIDILVAQLSNDHFWQNGVFPVINLPETASPNEVIAQCFKMTGFNEGRIKTYKILETKTVRIPGSLPVTYTAALVDSDLGQKIVLIKHIQPDHWWTRVYNADNLPNHQPLSPFSQPQ